MSTARPVPLHQLARERAVAEDIRHVGDDDLVRAVLGKDVALTAPISALATASSQRSRRSSASPRQRLPAS